MRFLLCLSAAAFLLAACASSEVSEASLERAMPQTALEIDFAKTTLEALQSLSFEKNREYCGYIGLDAAETYIATRPKKGRKGSCRPKRTAKDVRVLASYHTHGAFYEDYDSETPSSDDLLADIDEGIDGYVATPGGRVWFLSKDAKTATLLCGEDCITADPNYDPKDRPNIKPQYTLPELIDLDTAR